MTIVNITDRELELERLLKQSEHTATIAYMSGFYDGKKSRWIGLTDSEVQWIYDHVRTHVGAIRMTEAKLKEKNSTSPPVVLTSAQKN